MPLGSGFGDTPVIHSLGYCTCRTDVGGHVYVLKFIVLSRCITDIILGCDFPRAREAAINCVKSKLFLSAFPESCSELPDAVPHDVAV